ncbi:xylulose kinase-1 [Tanacetum coccineum]
MATLKFASSHSMVAFLDKPTESNGFEQIVDFLKAHPIKYALTVNPTIYTSCIEQFWTTAKVKTVNGEVHIQALVDKKKVIITETSVRSDLQLEDAEGTECLSNATIFEQLTLMSAKTTAWNEFSSTMASAVISSTENAIEHIRKVLEVASLFKPNDYALLRVFPLTLVRVAKRWFDRTSPEHEKNWYELKQIFIQRFCPPAIILKQLGEIRNFKQEEGESLFHNWERYNDLLFKCPFPDLNDHQKVNTFYNGLKGQTRRLVDSNGLIPGLTASEESCKRQDVLNEWMKKFMINTEMNLKDHDSSIKILEENVNHLAQLISIHNLTNQESAIKLKPASEKPTLKAETFIEKDEKVLIILGRPMLATAHTRIDVFGKKISLEVGTGQIAFDINERESPADLGSFPNDNDLLPNLESQDTMFLSPPGSAIFNNNSSGMFCNTNSNSSISLDDFVEMDDVWDNLDLEDLTNKATNSPLKPEFFM